MNDPFEKKVRAAAVAGWWVILIGYVAAYGNSGSPISSSMSARPGMDAGHVGAGGPIGTYMQSRVALVHGGVLKLSASGFWS